MRSVLASLGLAALVKAVGVWDACGAGAVCDAGLTCVAFSQTDSQCAPNDAAGEQPQIPVTVTATVTVAGPTATVTGAAATVTVTASAAACTANNVGGTPLPTSDIPIYVDGGLVSGFQDWSWSTTINYAATDLFEGTSSMLVNASAWGAASFKGPNLLSQYAGVTFDIAADPTTVQIYFQSSANASEQTTPVPLTTFGNITPDSFTTVVVDFTDFGNATYDRINFQGEANGAIFHLDNVGLLPGSTTTGGGGTPTGSGSLPTSTSTVNSLDQLAKANGKLYFGSATDNPEFTNTAYMAILTGGEFGATTPGNAMKWGPTEPTQGTYTYAQGDQVVSIAKNASMIVRGHNLVWDQETPAWLATTTWTNDTLIAAIQDHITSEVTHYQGQLYCWDVVNEPFSDSGGMRDWLVQDTIGTAYIALALQAARAADPSAKLYINDYNLEFAGAKFTTALETVQQLVADGVPLDGIGFEGHMIVGEVPAASALAAQMEQFTSLGLEVAITELDIRMTLPATAALYEQQQADYQNMVAACMMVEKCVGVTLWDYTDLYSWVPGTFSGQGAACPWDSNLQRKPAYDGIVAGLSGSS